MSNEKIFVADQEKQKLIIENTEKIIADISDFEKEKHKRYGIRINKNDSNPESRCEYILDAVGMKPAKMNYLSFAFDYGSWADVFFVKNNYPCMLNYDGNEAYKLNPNDYTKRIDGINSDVENLDFGGNAMSAIPLVWISQFEVGNYEYMIICDIKYDDSYHAYMHTREDGTIADVFYERMFEASFDGKRLRSLSTQEPAVGFTYDEQINFAKMNGENWYIGTYASWNTFEVMLKIMSKSEDCQTAFGKGNCESEALVKTGNLRYKGAFFGSNNAMYSVKVFHCENWWGNIDERRAGLVSSNYQSKVKMTQPYNTGGDGYDETGVRVSSTDTCYGYASKTLMTDKGRHAIEFNGSESTYTCDYQTIDRTSAIALTGGSHKNAQKCGCGCVFLDTPSSATNCGVSLSCEQPLIFE